MSAPARAGGSDRLAHARTHPLTPGAAGHRRSVDGHVLQYGVVSYNIVECLIALFVGRRIQSIALFGFGLDGMVEIAASAALLVHLKRNGRREGSPWEGRVARFIGVTLVVLALFIFNDAMLRLIYVVKPEESVIAMVLASVSLAVMLRVARAEQALALGLNSVALRAESPGELRSVPGYPRHYWRSGRQPSIRSLVGRSYGGSRYRGIHCS